MDSLKCCEDGSEIVKNLVDIFLTWNGDKEGEITLSDYIDLVQLFLIQGRTGFSLGVREVLSRGSAKALRKVISFYIKSER